jgi:hypothetical protein
VLSASVAAAVRIALQQWRRPAADSRTASGLVVPSGSLPDLLRLRTALAPLTPALDDAEDNHAHDAHTSAGQRSRFRKRHDGRDTAAL